MTNRWATTNVYTAHVCAYEHGNNRDEISSLHSYSYTRVFCAEGIRVRGQEIEAGLG